MLLSLVAAFRIKELRDRILFVFGMFAVFIVGLHVPVPGVDKAFLRALDQLFRNNGALTLLDLFSGGALRRYSVFAMGITPYINASIIMQLLTVAIPQLEELSKEGESGRRQISAYTRYLTVILALVQAIGMNTIFVRQGILKVTSIQFFLIIVTVTAGTAFLMWMGEMITDKGIGNGVSLVIFCSIMARLPYEASTTYTLVVNGAVGLFNVMVFLFLWLLTVAAVVAITEAQRKIPIQHAKRMVGNRMYGGNSSFLPFRVNSAGVIPIIFALSLVMIPKSIAAVLPDPASFAAVRSGGALVAIGWVAHLVAKFFDPVASGGWRIVSNLILAGVIIFFTYFYTAVTVNVPDIADNLKKYGSFIPGIRPGKPTQEYLDRVVSRITLAGAIFLAFIALLQYWLPGMAGMSRAPFSLYGGTSLLIVVGVALETMQTIEAHLMMRNYESFMK